MALNISFSRVYMFSAAHRLHSGDLTDKQNIDVYDKCNNPYGHGHNYTLEVTVKGKPNPDTGMILSLEDLDNKVNSLLKKLDYKHLDNEVPFFQDHVSSGENIVQFLWNELGQRIQNGLLYHIKLWETNNNAFEIGKDV